MKNTLRKQKLLEHAISSQMAARLVLNLELIQKNQQHEVQVFCADADTGSPLPVSKNYDSMTRLSFTSLDDGVTVSRHLVWVVLKC